MEHRIKNLEDLCELITKEVVDQNKNMIDMNKNLISEIRALREAYVKQDEDFEEFKNLLRKIYDLNRQNFPPPMFPPNMPPISHPCNIPQNLPGPINNSIIDHINQSMLNNLSFQSVQTPLNKVQNLQNLNQTMPSSASAMIKQTQPDFSQPPPQVKPVSGIALPIYNPPQIQTFSGQSQVKSNQSQAINQPTQPISTNGIKFTSSITTTSTPQANQFAFKTAPQSTVQTQIEKPPVFDFSPTKSGETKPASSKPTLKPTPSSSAVPTGIFGGSNLFKPSESNKESLFSNLSSKENIFKPEPICFGNVKKNQSEDNEEGEAAGNPEEYEPQIEFKPIVNLKEVEVKTGEEDEEIMLKLRCKLFRFDNQAKEWKEKGLGDLKLLRNKETKIIRVVMRREQVLKLCANHRVSGGMKINEISPKQLSWIASDFSENEPKTEVLLAKFRTIEEATQFKAEFEKAVKAMKALDLSKSPTKTERKTVQIQSNKSSLAEALKSDSWKCSACYAPNKKEDLKCACCSTLKPSLEGNLIAKDNISNTLTNNLKTSAEKQFSFGLQSQQKSEKIEFSSKDLRIQNSVLFNTLNTPSSPAPITQPILFEKKSLPSFDSLAASSTPIFGKKETTSNETNLFNPLGFSGGFGTQNNQTASLFGSKPPPLFGSQTVKAEEAEEEAENQNPEEYEPQVEFKPLVKLQEVEVKSGEENEEAIFKQRCKLYRYDSILKEWKEKGTGEIKILKHKANENMFRILMRRDQVLKLCANHRITNDLKWELFNDKQVRWYVQDYSEGEGKHELLAVRFKNEEDAKNFKQLCEASQQALASESIVKKVENKKIDSKNICDGLKPSLSAMFKQTGWTCSGCYVVNKEDIKNCLACQKMRDEAILKPDIKEITSEKEEKANFLFGQASNFSQSSISFSQSFGQSLNNEVNKQESKKIENIFGSKSGPSFSDLAKSTNTFIGGFTGGFGTQNNQTASLFGSKPPPLFGSQTVKAEEAEEEAENQNPEEYEPQVEFKPLVKLNEIEVKTGEEDEEILFKQRCKLFRFDSKSKEWKEKGVGEIKILKHKFKENNFRVLMRRDQVLKICANHRITPEIKLELINEKQVRWFANDCSEGTPQTELLAAKFRSEDDVKKFLHEFENSKKLSKNIKSSSVPLLAEIKNDLSNKLKAEHGSWTCQLCLIVNKPNTVKCASCGTEKQSKYETNDVKIVYEAKPTDEQIEKARSFGLPDTFYLYEKKTECKGCVGCENEE